MIFIWSYPSTCWQLRIFQVNSSKSYEVKNNGAHQGSGQIMLNNNNNNDDNAHRGSGQDQGRQPGQK